MQFHEKIAPLYIILWHKFRPEIYYFYFDWFITIKIQPVESSFVETTSRVESSLYIARLANIHDICSNLRSDSDEPKQTPSLPSSKISQFSALRDSWQHSHISKARKRSDPDNCPVDCSVVYDCSCTPGGTTKNYGLIFKEPQNKYGPREDLTGVTILLRMAIKGPNWQVLMVLLEKSFPSCWRNEDK